MEKRMACNMDERDRKDITEFYLEIQKGRGHLEDVKVMLK
jgi:hypothetical protein